MADLGMAVLDVGCYDTQAVDYPDVAEDLAGRIATGDHQRGILICGTGIGMAIAANKVPGVWAAQCHDTYSAERARKSNNAQVLTMGARVIGPELAKQIVDSWLNSEFAGGASARKVAKIERLEEKHGGTPFEARVTALVGTARAGATDGKGDHPGSRGDGQRACDPLVHNGHDVRLWGTELDDAYLEAIRRGQPHPRLGLVSGGGARLFASHQPGRRAGRRHPGRAGRDLTGGAVGLRPCRRAPAGRVPVGIVSKGFADDGAGRVRLLPEVLDEAAPGTGAPGGYRRALQSKRGGRRLAYRGRLRGPGCGAAGTLRAAFRRRLYSGGRRTIWRGWNSPRPRRTPTRLPWASATVWRARRPPLAQPQGRPFCPGRRRDARAGGAHGRAT